MQHTTTIGNRTLLFVKMPEGSYRFKVFNDEWRPYLSSFLELYPGCIATHREYLLVGAWQLLGKVGEIKEEQAAVFLEETDNPYWKGQDLKFIDYESDDNCFATALESFQSLLRKERVYLVNPYGEKPEVTEFMYTGVPDEIENAYNKSLAQWQDAEERTGNWICLLQTENK